MAALAILLAAPVSAQTLTVKASVPFDFVVGARTMPAGEYVVSTGHDFGILQIRNLDKSIAPVFAVTNGGDGPSEGEGVFLTFNRYGGDYFLAQLWDRSGGVGCSIPMSRTEWERVRSASLGKPEVVMVLAHR